LFSECFLSLHTNTVTDHGFGLDRDYFRVSEGAAEYSNRAASQRATPSSDSCDYRRRGGKRGVRVADRKSLVADFKQRVVVQVVSKSNQSVNPNRSRKDRLRPLEARTQ
jgi:hypothetical protein